MKSSDRIIETDVLVIGAGLAGCSAAYAAAQQGLKVTLITGNIPYLFPYRLHLWQLSLYISFPLLHSFLLNNKYLQYSIVFLILQVF